MTWREVEHTADWAIEVVAPSIDQLFLEAADGLYGLAGCTLGEATQPVDFEVDGIDDISLLVAFLQELLYWLDVHHVAFDDINIERSDERVKATGKGREVTAIVKTIKAVTFHDLAIVEHPKGFTATIVVDV